MNVRSYRGANIDSDNFMVIIWQCARISNEKKQKSAKQIRYYMLEDENRERQSHIKETYVSRHSIYHRNVDYL